MGAAATQFQAPSGGDGVPLLSAGVEAGPGSKTDKPVHKVPLERQLQLARDVLARSYRTNMGLVKHGKLLPAEAEDAIAVARALRDTLALLVAYEVEIKEAVRAAKRAERLAVEAGELSRVYPLSRVLQTFPGSEITRVTLAGSAEHAEGQDERAG